MDTCESPHSPKDEDSQTVKKTLREMLYGQNDQPLPPKPPVMRGLKKTGPQFKKQRSASAGRQGKSLSPGPLDPHPSNSKYSPLAPKATWANTDLICPPNILPVVSQFFIS
ncbi:hypothetical protein DSO57_1029307 [Entomophthora muscae]|uniref:Uncharacterized protein n=1 Tax=Entomophthora muscae TaxID=34485 RepID=A0ACC2RFV2_9FUNG|nr:hypothetical protein DSO57_1029307 [Entomophthora muscae]